MMTLTADDQPQTPPSPTTHAVLRIAHRAGNERGAVASALAAGVDWIEADIWYAQGRLQARHERALWRLPVLYDKWSVRLRPRLLGLADLLRLTDEHGTHIFVDVKGLHPRLPAAIARTVRDAGALGRVAVCGQYWPVLDAIGREEPAIPVYHSIGRPEQMALYRQQPAASTDTCAAGLSVARSLLTTDDVHALHARGLRIVAWTVNNADEAAKLARWGVDGITSDRLDVLETLP